MKRAAVFATLLVFFLLSSTYAISVGGSGGTWPKSAPKELEPLRKKAWTWWHGRTVKGRGQYTSYEIPFNDRAEFESYWPHLLKLKAETTTLTLVLGKVIRAASAMSKFQNAGVRIVALASGDRLKPDEMKIRVTDIQLVVDAKIVDLNRIQLPQDMRIIDKRFE